MVKVNFKDVKGFENLPDGDYNTTFTEFKVKDSKSTPGEQVVNFTFTVNDGEYNGRKLFRTFSLQPNALWALKQAVVRIGADADELEDPEVELEDLLGALIGNEVPVRATSKTVNGRSMQNAEVLESGSGW